MLKLGKLGEASFGILKLGELGKASFGVLKLGGLGEASFGKLKLGELGANKIIITLASLGVIMILFGELGV